MMYATALLRGEAILKTGLGTASLSDMLAATIRAEAVFPASIRLREASANLPAQITLVDPILALAFLKRAQANAPHDPMLWYWRARTHARAGDLLSARESLARLRAIAPDWPETQSLATLLKESPP